MHIKAHPAPYRVQPTNANCGTSNFPGVCLTDKHGNNVKSRSRRLHIVCAMRL